jgi:hypothetical protein
MDTAAIPYPLYLGEILPSLGLWLPGLKDVYLVTYALPSSEERMNGWHFQYGKEISEPEELEVDIESQEWTKLGNRSKAFEWLEDEEVPFFDVAPKAGQIDLFSGLKKEVLFMRLRASSLEGYDFVFLRFTEIAESPGVKGIRKGLDIPAREYIGLLLHSLFSHWIGEWEKRQEASQHFVSQTRAAFGLLKREREAFADMQERYQESLLKLAESALGKLAERYGLTFSLGEKAREWIKDYQGDLSGLNKRIENAAAYAHILMQDQLPAHIILEDWYFQDTDSKMLRQNADIQEIRKKPLESRGGLSRTFELLDKLETAAREASNKQLKLTSTNVGRMCPSPISAPAITDSIRNHRKRIVRLLARHPEKWPLIRAEFKPIQNALDKELPLLEKESA